MKRSRFKCHAKRSRKFEDRSSFGARLIVVQTKTEIDRILLKKGKFLQKSEAPNLLQSFIFFVKFFIEVCPIVLSPRQPKFCHGQQFSDWLMFVRLHQIVGFESHCLIHSANARFFPIRLLSLVRSI